MLFQRNDLNHLTEEKSQLLQMKMKQTWENQETKRKEHPHLTKNNQNNQKLK